MSGAALLARNLRFAYPNGTVAVDGVDVEAPRRELTVLAGRNGSGKTALLRLLSGLVLPSSGSVLYEDREPASYGRAYCARVACVFQNADAQFLGDTAIDDARFGPLSLGRGWEEASRAAAEALAECGLAGLGDRYTHELSGGERRRLAIAGMLAMRPEAVLLDEPFANLDLDSVRGVTGVLRGLLARGSTVVVATHELEKVLGLASHFVVLERGRVAWAGHPRDISGPELERFGLRDPFRRPAGLADLSWTD